MTPLISAETWLGAAGWASGSQMCKRRQPRLGAGADQGERENRSRDPGRRRMAAHRPESEVAGGAAEQAEGEQQGEGPERRHENIDIAGADVVAFAMMGHDQGPGGERHQLPGKQEGIGVVGEDDEIHRRHEQREKGQHAALRAFMAAIAERVEARGGGAEIDDGQEEGGQGVDAEMGAEPRQAERQGQGFGGRRREQALERRAREQGANQEDAAVDEKREMTGAWRRERDWPERQQGTDGEKIARKRHARPRRGARRNGKARPWPRSFVIMFYTSNLMSNHP